MSSKSQVKKGDKKAPTREELSAQLKVVADKKAKYFKENKLKTGVDYSADKKHGKVVSEMNAKISELEAAIKSSKSEKSDKPKTKDATTSRKAFAPKYEYPADVTTDAQKKEFRRKARAAAAGKVEKPKTEKTKAEKPNVEKSSKTGKVDKAKKRRDED